MTIRKPVAVIENKWHDAQRVDETDLNVEQAHNNQIDAATIQNHFGSGVLLDSPQQVVLFDSDDLDSTSAALLAAGNFDGTGISVVTQPSDINLGNQLEVELTGSAVFGRSSVKVVIIGLSFDDELIYDRFYFYRDDKQVTSRHYKEVLTVLFNDFLGNNNCSRNNGGRITIKEALPLELSRDTIMISQDVEPNIFFRDFKIASKSSNIFTTIQSGMGAEYSADGLEINITPKLNRSIGAGDITTHMAQKFLAQTDNLQKITLLMGVTADGYAAESAKFNWSGDIVVSIYKLQTSVNCPTSIVPDLAIEFDPEAQPLMEVSYSQSELAETGYVLTDVLQPVDFVFSGTTLGMPGGLEEGAYYLVSVNRTGSADTGEILFSVGNDRTDNSRLCIYSSGVWTDIADEDMWFQVWTDAVKIASGSAYDEGVGAFLAKTTTDTETGATIDYEARHYSFADTGETSLNIGVIEATVEESIKVQDERTGNTVNARQTFVPSFSLVTESGLADLQSVGEPVINGCIFDLNPKGGDIITGTQNYPGLAQGDSFCLINPDPDLLSLNLVGRKLVPNTDNAGLEYKIFKVTLCTDGYGDVLGDGDVGPDDVLRASELIGESLSLTSTQTKIANGDISTLELLRADVDGDGIVTSLDVASIQDFVNRTLVSFPVGASFTHMCLEVGSITGRYDGYYDCDGYIRSADGYSDPVDPSTLSVTELIYDGYLSVPSIEGADPAFLVNPFVAIPFSIVALPFWQDYLLSHDTSARIVPAAFTYSNAIDTVSCATPSVSLCTDRTIQDPTCDPGRNDFYVPDNLIIDKGILMRADGSPYPADLELATIILTLPDVEWDEININIPDRFLIERGSTGLTSFNYPAARFFDCTTVKSDALVKNQVRFGVSIQSINKQTDGYSSTDGYFIINDPDISIYMDQSTGILTVSNANSYVDPVFLSKSTKIQVLCYLKKSGFKNGVIFVSADETGELVSA